MAVDVAKSVVQITALTSKFDMGAESVQPFYPDIATVVPSKVRAEDYGWLGSMAGVREWVGERRFQGLRAARYQLVNKLWEQSHNIDREDIEDDRLSIYGPILEQMGVEAGKHPDELMFGLLTNGAAAASQAFDGSVYFSATHAWGDSGTQDNTVAATGTGNPALPTATEWKASFNTAFLKMMQFKNDNGKFYHRPILTRQSGLIAVVPPNQWQAARDAMEAVVISATQNITLAQIEIIPSPYLTNTAVWYLLKTDEVMKPFVFQERRPIQRSMKGMDDREFRAVKFMTDARYNAGYLAWWCAVQVTFS